MSTSPPPASPLPPPTPPVGAITKPMAQEIKVVAHSTLLYWWPVWFFGFVFSLLTFIDNDRMAIVSHESKVVKSQAPDGRDVYNIRVEGDKKRLIDDSEPGKDNPSESTLRVRVSPRTWMGPVFFVILFLVVMITNIPLRGLWSLVAIITIAMVALLLSLFEKWDILLRAMGDLHVFVNLAGYLAISTALFIIWMTAVMVFDQRTYMIFSPGQVKVCEEIGGREKVFDTTNLSLEKRRDDWFRHIILGFGTGDLTVKTAGADRHEIILPNVAFIASKIDAIESMLRSRQIQPKA